MGMQHLEGDSGRVTQVIDMGKDLTRLVREFVVADRHSRQMSEHGTPTGWTNAAKERDAKLRALRESLTKYAKSL